MYALIISMSLLSATATQDKPEVNVETQAVLERVDSAGAWVSASLDQLASKLGTTVEYLWPTFVKNIFVTGLMEVISGTLALIISCILSFLLIRLRNKIIHDWQENRGREGWPESACFVQVISFTLLIVGTIMFIAFLFNGIVSMVAPEPEALQNIAKAIGQLK